MYMLIAKKYSYDPYQKHQYLIGLGDKDNIFSSIGNFYSRSRDRKEFEEYIFDIYMLSNEDAIIIKELINFKTDKIDIIIPVDIFIEKHLNIIKQIIRQSCKIL